MSLSRQQLTLLGIFALFFGPLLLVILMRSSWWQYQPSGLKNKGQLVQPPVHVSIEQTQDMDGKWLILYELDQPCLEDCIERVTALRQIHRAVGRHADHLGIALIGSEEPEPALRARLEAIYPAFNVLTDNGQSAKNVLDPLDTDIIPGSADLRTYILDPMHNVVLAYYNDADPSDIHKDLKRLLKWSDQEAKK